MASIDGVGEEAVRRRLAEGMVDYGEGRRLFAASDTERAREPLERSKERLASSGCPMWRWAEIWLAGSDLYRFDYSHLDPRLRGLRTTTDPGAWPALWGRIHWASGMAARRRGFLGDALASYSVATESFERALDAEGIAASRGLAAETLQWLGRSATAWAERIAALRALATAGSNRRHDLLWGGGVACLGGPLNAAALDFLDEDVATTDVGGGSVARTEARLRRAQVRLAEGLTGRAIDDLASSRASAQGILNEPQRARALAQIRRWEAEALIANSPRHAVSELNEVLSYYQRHSLVVGQAEIVIARARATLAVGDPIAAEADLSRALALSAKESRSAADLSAWRRQVEAMQDLFDELVAEAVARGDILGALELAERARANAAGQARQALSPAEPRPLFAPGFERGIQDGVLLVVYLVTLKRSYVWALRATGVRLAILDIDRTTIERDAAEFLASLRSSVPAPDSSSAGTKLYDVLLGPLAAELEDASSLIVVPDRALSAIPFAALRPGGPRFLVERMAVAYASGVGAVLGDGWRGPIAGGSNDVLLVGNPDLSGILPNAAALPSAELELSALESLYPDATVLTGPKATVKHVLEALSTARIAHLAVHSTAGPDHPWRPALRLSAADGNNGGLTEMSMPAGRFPRLQTVVLSACATAAREGGRTGILSDLARAFLERGASAVVGYLGPIDDRLAAEVSVRVHQNLGEHVTVSDAVRKTQLALLSDTEPLLSHPATWSALEVFVHHQR